MLETILETLAFISVFAAALCFYIVCRGADTPTRGVAIRMECIIFLLFSILCVLADILIRNK